MFGSHLSISGGMHNALLEAEKLGFDVVQVFTKNQQQWKCKPLDAPCIEQWRLHCDRLKYKHTVSHDSYLINLASPDEALRRKSVELFIEELSRCMQLRIPYLVTHPGAHMGQGEEIGLKRVAASLDEVHAAVPRNKVSAEALTPSPPYSGERAGVRGPSVGAGKASGSLPLARRKSPSPSLSPEYGGEGSDHPKSLGCGVLTCLEITAGQGTSLGYKLEHLAEIISLVKDPERLGVCLDTAHLFAAGYDFRGRKYAGFMRQVDSIIGIGRVKVLHLNDSKKELGSRVDRHEHIGRGTIGLEGFKGIVRDKAFRKIPKILETAKEKNEAGRDWDAVNLEVLKGLM